MIHFDPHAAKIVTEFVLARIISAAIGPVSDSLPMLLAYLRITSEIVKIVNISASQSFRGSSLLFLHSITRLHILATQLHTGYGGMERE